MAELTALTSSYFFKAFNISSGDVADAIVNIRAELLSRNNPAWTEPSGNLFKSPVDSAGRFFDCLFTRIDQQTLEMRVRDQLAHTVCTRRFQAGTAPWIFQVFSGQFHLIAEAASAGGYANLCAGVLDQSPDAQGANPVYVYGGGWLTNANSNDGYHTATRVYMYDSQGSSVNDRGTCWGWQSGSACHYNMNGSKIYRPAELNAQYGNNQWRVAGRRYQQLLCASDLWYGQKVTIPLDSVSGTFMVTCTPTGAGSRLMCRIA